MRYQDVSFEELAEAAADQPLAMVQAMAERDGENEGGLTLSREHIITINKYVNYVYALPRTQDNLERWLGYQDIDEPELKPASMEALFGDLRGHAGKWTPLSDKSKQLSSELASTANKFKVTGKEIVDECERLKDKGLGGIPWEEMELAQPIPLSENDQEAVTLLVEYMKILNTDASTYADCVDRVVEECAVFRDEIQLKLLPAVADKDVALERKKGDGEVERLRGRLKDLDAEIAELKAEYDQYLKLALGSLAGGALGAIIGGSIYGSKAERVRKERKKREAERRDIAEQLRVRLNLEGRLTELVQFVDDLDARLRDVAASAKHLHSMWGHVDAYTSGAVKQLELIKDGQKLAIFVLMFKRFLGQWEGVERFSLHLTRVFDNAISAR